jgi:hypothetical protein
MRYYLTGILVFIILTGNSNSQQPDASAELTLLENHFDFGYVYAAKGKVQHTFKFKNTGKQALQITNVRSTCGCTLPFYTKDSVLPGDEGLVKVEYDPSDIRGNFHKTVQIQSTARNSNMFLTISGIVIPAPKKGDLRFKVGELSIRSKHLNLGYVFKGDTAHTTMLMSNQTDKELYIDFADVPGYIDIQAKPPVLKPGDYGYIELTYFSGLTNDWDVVIDRIPVLINGTKDEEVKIPVTANIREDFSYYTEEDMDHAPVARFANSTQSFSIKNKSNPLDCKFKLTNLGQTDLVIRAVKPSCGCTAVKPENDILKPGESTFIEASFDPAGREGNVRNSITVITNDPKDYKQYLYIEGEVQP